MVVGCPQRALPNRKVFAACPPSRIFETATQIGDGKGSDPLRQFGTALSHAEQHSGGQVSSADNSEVLRGRC